MTIHKYFLRGFGTALILTASIFYFTNINSMDEVLSDQDIIEKAKVLGMIEKDDAQKAKKPSEQEIIERAKELGMVFENEAKQALEAELRQSLRLEITKELEAKAEDVETETLKQEEDKKSQIDNNESVKDSHKAPETIVKEEVSDQRSTVELTIEYGMASDDVAKLLYNHGIIDHIREFDTYLMVHGYDQKIKTGTYIFHVNSTYKEAMKNFTN